MAYIHLRNCVYFFGAGSNAFQFSERLGINPVSFIPFFYNNKSI